MRDAVAAADTASIGQFTLPAITINGRKKAQSLAYTTDTGCRLTGSSFEASADEATQLDSQGAEVAYGFAGAVASVSAELTEVTAACGVTLDTSLGFTEQQPEGADRTNTEYATTSFTAEKILVRS